MHDQYKSVDLIPGLENGWFAFILIWCCWIGFTHVDGFLQIIDQQQT